MNGSDLTPKHDQLKEKLVHGRCHYGTRSMGHKPDSVGGTLDGEGCAQLTGPARGRAQGAQTPGQQQQASNRAGKRTKEQTLHQRRHTDAEAHVQRQAKPFPAKETRFAARDGTHTYQKHRDHGRRWEGYRAWTPHSRLVGMQNAIAALETASPGL